MNKYSFHRSGWVCLLIISALAWTSVCAGVGDASTRVKVRKAVDGDTLLLADGRWVRLIGIDSPEIDHKKGLMQPFADKARDFLNENTAGKQVRLEMGPERYDRHKRLLAYVYATDGRLLNQAIVAQGLAYVLYVRPNVMMHDAFLAAQREAMTAERGIWQTIKFGDGPFTGNRHSRRFHLADCPMGRRIRKSNIVRFDSARDAFHAGYAPCKRCLQFPKNKRLKRN